MNRIKRRIILSAVAVALAAAVITGCTGCTGSGEGFGKLLTGVGGFGQGVFSDLGEIGTGITDALAQPRYPEPRY